MYLLDMMALVDQIPGLKSSLEGSDFLIPLNFPIYFFSLFSIGVNEILPKYFCETPSSL